jgi:hypothetical protein
VLIYGFPLIGLANEQANANILRGPYPSNFTARFAIVTIFWLSIAAAQYLYIRIFHFRFIRNPLTLFIDKCSLANISLLLLPESNFGYYIHGESVHQFSDANMREFNEYLHKERTNTVLSRGLVPDPLAPSIQTYEVYITHEFRRIYNEKLLDAIAHENLRLKNQLPPNRLSAPPQQQQSLLNQEQQPQNTKPIEQPIQYTSAMMDDGMSLNRFYKFMDMGLTLRRKTLYPHSLFDSYMDLNEHLKQFINELKLKQDQIMQKQLTMRLGIPPDLSMVKKDYFYYDSLSYTFKNVLPMGSEWRTLIFHIVTFAIIDVGAKNPFFSILGVYLFSKFLKFIQSILFRRNIVNKTLLDDRFIMN